MRPRTQKQLQVKETYSSVGHAEIYVDVELEHNPFYESPNDPVSCRHTGRTSRALICVVSI